MLIADATDGSEGFPTPWADLEGEEIKKAIIDAENGGKKTEADILRKINKIGELADKSIRKH